MKRPTRGTDVVAMERRFVNGLEGAQASLDSIGIDLHKNNRPLDSSSLG